MSPDASKTERRELGIFLFLSVLLWPMLAIAIVAGYGFCVWMLQLIMGPPSG